MADSADVILGRDMPTVEDDFESSLRELLPERWSPGQVTPAEMSQIMEQYAGALQYGTDELSSYPAINMRADTDMLRGIAISRYNEAIRPTPTNPAVGMTPDQVLRARQVEAARLRGMLTNINSVDTRRAALQQFRVQFPDLADELGLSESWFEATTEKALKLGGKGVSALDFLLRNLDRGRGAITSFQLARNQGMDVDAALQRGKAAFQGSERGFVWHPEMQGPTWKEVLVAGGMADEGVTSAIGFAMDVLADPVNLFGLGASRRGIQLGSHQILNAAGREIYGDALRVSLQNMAKELKLTSVHELPLEMYTFAERQTVEAMRKYINQTPEAAREFLDFGGLKVAGYSLAQLLPDSKAFRRRQSFVDGTLEFDVVPNTLARLFGDGVVRKVARLGELTYDPTSKALLNRVPLFMKTLPENLARAGEEIGRVIARTNPRAGKEYTAFKQAEYYDLLGYEMTKIREKTDMIFDGIDGKLLEDASLAMESGPTAVMELLLNTRVKQGETVANKLGNALTRYRSWMDEVVLDEVERGWFNVDLSAPELKVFKQWLKREVPDQAVPPEMLRKFNKVRIRGYVPHFYWNKGKADAMSPTPVLSRSPSITEPFTHRRVVETLDLAMREGLQPELNLRTLTAIRTTAHARAKVTHDFLAGVAQRYGLNVSGFVGKGSRIVLETGKPLPHTRWKDLEMMRTNSNGKVVIDITKQKDMAYYMAYESYVQPQTIAKLEDDAIRVFLREKFRVVSARDAEKAWQKFVTGPTDQGLYNGIKLAPATTRDAAVSVAKDLSDPAYIQWIPFKAGGKADPTVLGRVYLPAPIARDLAMLKWSLVPPQLKNIVGVYDWINFNWKRAVTIPFPAFHVRNKITNVVNSAMDIGLGVLDRGDLSSIMQGMEGFITTEDGRKISYSLIRQAARRYGVVRPMYRRIDIAEMMQDLAAKEGKARVQLAKEYGFELEGRKALLEKGEGMGEAVIHNPLLAPLRAGGDIGLAIENSDRLQLFIKSLERGMPIEQAAARVNKFLFDYDDLSVLERDFIRKFLNPFWTWTRKNIALQMKVAANTPGRFVVPSKFARAWSEDTEDAIKSDIEREFLPRWIGDTFAIRTEAHAQGLSKWWVGMDIPQEDINRLWQGNYRKTMVEWLSGMGPLVRDPLEDLVQYDFYRDKSTAQFQRGTKVYDIIEYMPKLLRDDFLKARKDRWRDVDVWRVDPKRWKALNWMTLYMGTRLYTTAGKLADPKQGSVAIRMVNFLTGMRWAYINPEEEIRRVAAAAVGDKTGGLKQMYDAAWKQAEQALIQQRMLEGEAGEFLRQVSDGAATPERPAETDFTNPPTENWMELDGI